MKKIFCVLLSFIMIFSLTSCTLNTHNKNLDNEEIITPVDLRTEALNSVEYNESGSMKYFDDAEFLKKLSRFSNKIYEMASEEENENYVVSPLSVYMALAVLNYIADENVQSNIETLFGMTKEDIEKTGELFLSLVRETTHNEKILSKLDLTNSIWFDTNVDGDKTVLQNLAEELYCYAFKTTFRDNNQQANEDITNFVKEKTNGLIDNDFALTEDTLFAIINTLYFKDIWNDGLNLLTNEEINKEIKEEIKFYFPDKSSKETTFLLGNYCPGQVAETECSNYFYIQTESGYKIKFVVPKDGFTLKDAMSTENLNIVNETKNYSPKDDKFDYFTRCIFPEFKIEAETNFKEVFEKNECLMNAFLGFTSNLVDRPLAVSDIIHQAVVDVNDEGVEAAAVTIIAVKETSVHFENPIYENFIINKNFGFIITTSSDVVLFEGQVTNP